LLLSVRFIESLEFSPVMRRPLFQNLDFERPDFEGTDDRCYQLLSGFLSEAAIF